MERGLNPERRRLFVIDGSKALRAGINHVFGSRTPVQRCRNHKVRNVLGYLPEERKADVEAAMKAAFKLKADKGIGKLEKLAEWLDREHPSAAGSLREGLSEMFTINRLGLPRSLRRCLASTNVIESPYSGVREKTGRVKRWRDGRMALRWTASALLSIEKRMRRIMGYQQLWMLDAALKELDDHTDDGALSLRPYNGTLGDLNTNYIASSESECSRCSWALAVCPHVDTLLAPESDSKPLSCRCRNSRACP